ncbi:unnamed protein product [Adineta steineri]|uniref:Uncharacterized protein n=1 Tax=Adineta steineri TaxID=433720 RepID=A0A815NM14_9BILA|nr:unnamed protein product [Adineta steineri]
MLFSWKCITIFLSILPFINTLNISSPLSAVSFLTREPSTEVVQFAHELSRAVPFIDVFILIDNNAFVIPVFSSSNLQFLQFNATVCTKYGFQEANRIGVGKSCSAWDKALYYFSKVSTHYLFVWFIEDDVFIPSVQAFLSLHEVYSPSNDMVTATLSYNRDGNVNIWHWRTLSTAFAPPWANGMVCAIGCSRRLLSAIGEYARWRGQLTFIENLFHTLAIQDGSMKIVTPFELNTIVYRDTYTLEQIQRRPNNWWHPVKQISLHREWRNKLIPNSSVNINNRIRKFYSTLQHLQTINATNSSFDFMQHIANLGIEIEIVKGHIKSFDRYQLRKQFLQLAQNLLKNLADLFTVLADHAFKLPEPQINRNMAGNKTVAHMMLEKAIEKNKQMILELTTNRSLSADEMVEITKLRVDAIRLIVKLSRQIRCELQVISCGPMIKSPSSQQFNSQLNDIEKQNEKIRQKLNQSNTEKNLSNQINQWERESIGKIQTAAKKARTEVQQLNKETNIRINNILNKITNELRSKRKANNCTERDIENLNNLLQTCTDQWKQLNELNIAKNDLSSHDLIKMDKTTHASEKETVPSLPIEPGFFTDRTNESMETFTARSKTTVVSEDKKQSSRTPVISELQSYPYPSIHFNVDFSSEKNIGELFERLRHLPEMDKTGPMSGNCDAETTQMERFLSQTFGFRNIPNEYIVHDVKSFRLSKHPYGMHPNIVIKFPDDVRNAFPMTIQEILDWQRSYKVYADKTVPGMTLQFLHGALQGMSKSGDEAFRMKFVVRISQCPILMDCNARIIPRELRHQWPSRIKLVSVAGIDFAGRIHDVNDITTYVTNWKNIYETDPKLGNPIVVSNGRDLQKKRRAARGELDEDRLLKDLMQMARLRLYACDKEKVQIVVETGIGLGVFAGKSIGIDGIVRALSAKAIRKVLEQEGPNYEHIRGVVFALPIFDKDIKNDQRNDVYQAFVDEFDKKKYNGCIPVMIADQDMHRLAIAIAYEGFTVSELNPADSHGVFGEYWQNRGPAVEEKLALTTLGLLVQHHLINPCVLEPKHYRFVQPKT